MDAPSVEGRWVLANDDEFTGTALDLTRWRPNRYGGASVDPPFNPLRELAAYAPSQVQVVDGELRLTAVPTPSTTDGRTWAYTSGTVSGQDGIVIRDGDLVEARIKVPDVGGMWPAFWAVTADIWPPEIDGFEFFDTGTQQLPQFNYHRSDGTQSGPTTYGEPGLDYRTSWHTFAWVRSGGRVTPYLDGKAYPSAGADRVDAIDYFPIINLAVRARPSPATGASATMAVDWVRVWSPG